MLVVLASAAIVYRFAFNPPAGLRPAHRSATGGVEAIAATTSTGRSGAYYLPPDWDSGTLPLMVALHGTGGKGAGILARLRALAERERFVIVAPDSVSIAGAWLVARGAHGVTEDHRHVMASVREVLALPRVQIDRTRTLVMGFSVGGGEAAYLASHEDLFNAFAVLHGHVPVGDLGPRRVRGWLSTGDGDRIRSVSDVRSTADHLVRERHVTDVEVRVFRGDHALGAEEVAALVAWWLDRR